MIRNTIFGQRAFLYMALDLPSDNMLLILGHLNRVYAVLRFQLSHVMDDSIFSDRIHYFFLYPRILASLYATRQEYIWISAVPLVTLNQAVSR